MDIFTRRRFLIGAISGLTTIMLDRFISHFANHGEPLIKNHRNPKHTLFISRDQEFQIGLDQHPFDYKFPNISLIEFLVKFYGESVPKSASDFNYFEMEYGYTERNLNGEVPIDLWYDVASRFGPCAMAHRYLSSLKIEAALSKNDQRFGGLNFYDGPTIGSDYLGVHAEDDVSVSLLQHRLSVLGHNVAIEMV